MYLPNPDAHLQAKPNEAVEKIPLGGTESTPYHILNTNIPLNY